MKILSLSLTLMSLILLLPRSAGANPEINPEINQASGRSLPERQTQEEGRPEDRDLPPKSRSTPQNQEAQDTGFHSDRRHKSDYQRDPLEDELK
jgi:hypothetical protein